MSGYPTLKIFRNGAFSADYKGPRDTGMPVLPCIGCSQYPRWHRQVHEEAGLPRQPPFVSLPLFRSYPFSLPLPFLSSLPTIMAVLKSEEEFTQFLASQTEPVVVGLSFAVCLSHRDLPHRYLCERPL